MAGDGAFASRGSGGLPAEGDCLSRLLGNGLEAMLMGGLHDRCARPAGRDGRRSPHPPRCAAGPAGRNGYPPGHCARRRRSGSQADRGRRAGRVARRVWCELGRTPAGAFEHRHECRAAITLQQFQQGSGGSRIGLPERLGHRFAPTARVTADEGARRHFVAFQQRIDQLGQFRRVAVDAQGDPQAGWSGAFEQVFQGHAEEVPL